MCRGAGGSRMEPPASGAVGLRMLADSQAKVAWFGLRAQLVRLPRSLCLAHTGIGEPKGSAVHVTKW